LDSYILDVDALSKLRDGPVSLNGVQRARSDDVSSPLVLPPARTQGARDGNRDPNLYERLVLHGRPYLCSIPQRQPATGNKSEAVPSESDREKELVQVASRGWQLLQDMGSHQCLFYTTGWWTYSFCYNSQVKQFHALPPGTNGRVWPPQEDPTTPSYILGRFGGKNNPRSFTGGESEGAELAELQSRADTNYLVKRLEGGTPCDLTGKNRKIEVQFHCNPQVTDRIGWIKETATCSYLMVIYTPRLCSDIAFLPPKESRAHAIICQEILTEEEIPAWEASRREEERPKVIDQGQTPRAVLGHVEVGAMLHVGKDGRKIERGRIVMTQDEKAETVIMQKNGQISSLSKAELEKLDLTPEDLESFRKELQKLAGSKDWRIERLDDVNGHIQLRGVVATDPDEDEEDELQDQQEAHDEREEQEKQRGGKDGEERRDDQGDQEGL